MTPEGSDEPRDGGSDEIDEILVRRAFAAGESVIEAVRAIHGDAPRVLLGEPESDAGASPLVRPIPAEIRPRPATRSRFQVQGEIARGGMGVVFKGHDPDLGRDVAIKVLREESARDADALQRFVEEAQIGGQLQHPGVVPVYEIGLLADERPYFAMKLVKGKTLAELLAERPDPAANRRRFLSLLLDVARTVAYAHARSVVHRDLKPSNVMVGRFGEVQVMDWGLAKVLRGREAERSAPASVSIIETVRSRPGTDSLAGSVRGTPSYMSPEQATGRVESIDARADVFSLGAILCEILTGAPPYPYDKGQALELAVNARLDGAAKALAACGAEKDLVELAKRCLAAAKSERPRDAGVVASALAAHLDAADERARRAEIDAVEARERAIEERKKKRLVVALGAATFLAVAAAVGGFLLLGARHERLRAETASAVQPLLDQAARLRGQAARTGEPAEFAEALSVIERARSLVDSREASDELRKHVASSADAVREEAARSAERRERERDDRALLARLEEVRFPEAAAPEGAELVALGAAIGAALAAHGIEPLTAPEEEVARAIASRSVRDEVAAALGTWADASDASDPTAAAKLRRVAAAADPDPVRESIRRAVAGSDRAALERLAASPELESWPAVTLATLVGALARAGDAEGAARTARTATLVHPGHFTLRLAAARAHLRIDPRRPDDALDHYAAALALRPGSVEVRHEMARVLEEDQANPTAALPHYEDAAELRPTDTHLAEHVERARRAAEAK